METWIIWVSPQCNHKCSHNRGAGGDLTTMEEGHVSAEANAMPLVLKPKEGSTEPQNAMNVALEYDKTKEGLLP